MSDAHTHTYSPGYYGGHLPKNVAHNLVAADGTVGFGVPDFGQFEREAEIECVSRGWDKAAYMKKCSFCGVIANKNYGTCEHCGAAL